MWWSSKKLLKYWKYSSPDRQQSHKTKLQDNNKLINNSGLLIILSSPTDCPDKVQATRPKWKGCQLTCSLKKPSVNKLQSLAEKLDSGILFNANIGAQLPSPAWEESSLNSSQFFIRNSLDGVQLCVTWHFCSHCREGLTVHVPPLHEPKGWNTESLSLFPNPEL